jgi:hypothetical protein
VGGLLFPASHDGKVAYVITRTNTKHMILVLELLIRSAMVREDDDVDNRIFFSFL